MHKLVFYLSLLFLVGMFSCARLDPAIRKSNSEEFAVQSGFSVQQIKTNQFTIWAASKGLNDNNGAVAIYIEGDGLAYKKRNRPSKNPTPIDYFTLQLAEREPASSVVYLARPCQYLSKSQLERCEQKYWTSHRYSEEVIDAYEEILGQLQRQSAIKEFVLVGYSGGGNIAAHLAARRKDVSRLITIAANLDLQTWTDYHSLLPMKSSLNPASDKRLSMVEQIHFAGAKDKIVPPVVVQQYVEKLGNPKNVELIIKTDFDHRCCWIEQWQGSEKLFGN